MMLILYWLKLKNTYVTDRRAQTLKIALRLRIEADGAAGIHATDAHLPRRVAVK